MLSTLRAAGTGLVLVGIVLGPLLGGSNGPLLRAVAPVAALAVGWIGALFGAQLDRNLFQVPIVWRAGLRGTAAFVAVAAGSWFLPQAIPALDAIWPSPPQRLPLSLMLGAIAAASGPGVTSLPGTTSPPGERRVAILDSGLGVVAFAVILAFYHPRTTGAGAAFWWAPWLLLAGTCGILIGLLFLSVTRVRHSPGDLILALLGCLGLGAGVGYAAGFSPIVVCWIVGAVIAALSPHRREVIRLLETWERPAFAVLLVVVGVWLALPTLWILAAAVVLAGFRVVARWLAALIPGGGGKVGSRAGLAQGGVVVALGASYCFVFGPSTGTGGWAMTLVVVGVALAQLVAALTVAPPTPEVRG